MHWGSSWGGEGGGHGWPGGWDESNQGANWDAGTSRGVGNNEVARAEDEGTTERETVEDADRVGDDGDSDGEASSEELSVMAEGPGQAMRRSSFFYTRADFEAGSEGSGYRRGEISETGEQEVEDAGPGDIFWDTGSGDAAERQAGGETESSTTDEKPGDERMEDRVSTEREIAEEGILSENYLLPFRQPSHTSSNPT